MGVADKGCTDRVGHRDSLQGHANMIASCGGYQSTAPIGMCLLAMWNDMYVLLGYAII
jgi:hypothetical protein